MPNPSDIAKPLVLLYRLDVARMFAAGSVTSPKPTRIRSRRFSVRSRRLFILLAAFVVVTTSGGTARANEPVDAGHFVARLTEDVIHRVIVPEIDERTRLNRLRALLSETLATERIGRFTLGRYWRTATRSERAAFLNIFADVMAAKFMPLLEAYSGEQIQIRQVRSDPNMPAIITVTSRLIRPHGQSLNVVWRVRRDGQSYRVMDVVAEGVSMAITLRAEYRSFIRQHGGRVASLISALRERIAVDAATRDTGHEVSWQ